jgi:hypothetical protein
VGLVGSGCGRSSLGSSTDLQQRGLGGAGEGGSGASGGYAGAGGAGGAGGWTTSSSSTSTTEAECLGPTDCNDGDDCTTDACHDGACTHEPRDDDGDGFVASSCGGEDCNDLNPEVFPAHEETCGDGSDNDCDGVADCFDPACAGLPNCGCVPNPLGEDCHNGLDDDCDGKADCSDPKCMGTPACGCTVSEVGQCDDGFDDDCDGKIDCDDADCFGTSTCQCKATPESCDNGKDDDCDLLVDCADPECIGSFACKCQPPGAAEVCSDGVDNDCDGKVDCADPDCLPSASCKACTIEVCDDGIDNSCDGKIDCADPSCALSPSCAPTAEVCSNGLDDDHDGKTDCQDPDCANNPHCIVKQANCLSPKLISASGTYTGNTTGNVSETKGACGGDAGEAVFYFVLTTPTKVTLDSVGTSFDSTLYVRTGHCNTGKEIACDDDSGGSHAAKVAFSILYPGTYYVFLDGYTVDPNNGANEGPFTLNVDFVPNPQEICDDGIDNDGDHYVDCADPDCANVGSCKDCNGGKSPTPEFGANACSDGHDNDCDGKIDCADRDCSASDYYVTECCNGADDNGNDIVDDFNCRCASNADCPGDQLCYDHTAFACGAPCDSFFGDVCPFVAPGSYCNSVTRQCEF